VRWRGGGSAPGAGRRCADVTLSRAPSPRATADVVPVAVPRGRGARARSPVCKEHCNWSLRGQLGARCRCQLCAGGMCRRTRCAVNAGSIGCDDAHSLGPAARSVAPSVGDSTSDQGEVTGQGARSAPGFPIDDDRQRAHSRRVMSWGHAVQSGHVHGDATIGCDIRARRRAARALRQAFSLIGRQTPRARSRRVISRGSNSMPCSLW